MFFFSSFLCLSCFFASYIFSVCFYFIVFVLPFLCFLLFLHFFLHLKFLAAMSSSRSDDITQFVRSFVRTLFFSFSVFGVCSALFQESFKGVSRKF